MHTKDFSKATIGSLKTKGITIIGSTMIPDANGSFLESKVVYNLNDRGTHIVRSHDEVVALANC